MTISEKLVTVIKKAHPEAFGTLMVRVENNVATITGELYAAVPDLGDMISETFTKAFPRYGSPIVAVEDMSTRRLHVVEASGSSAASKRGKHRDLDKVPVLFYGRVPVSDIKFSDHFKRENSGNRRNVEACIEVLDVMAPLILDRNLKVIDGDMRLAIAQERGQHKVLAVVLDDEGVKSDFLRLALNRSGEFQRWEYPEVDEYVDGTPQAQPLLEPLGFFGERILPVSFFGDTIMAYEIDPYNDQQKYYKQEYGLEEWAKMQRERIMAEEEAKKAKRAKAKTSTTVSLFDLEPQEEDFLPTYDPRAEVKAIIQANKDDAEVITQAYDAKRRAEKEARGQAWQTARRSSKKKAEDKRAAAEGALAADEEAQEEAFNEEAGLVTEAMEEDEA